MYRRILHFSENFKFLEGLLDSWKAKIGVALGISALISLLEYRDDVSSHLKHYQLSSEILEYKLILFRSGHFDHDMEKI